MEKQYINLSEAAELLGIDRRTFKRILIRAKQEGRLNYTKLGRKILINKSKLEKYIDTTNKINY